MEASIAFELTDERNALERVMLHFSDCRKETRRLDDKRYHVTLWYDPQDVTHIILRANDTSEVAGGLYKSYKEVR